MPPSALTTTFIQSTFLNAIANLLAQVIDQYHRGVRSLISFSRRQFSRNPKPFHLNPTALLQFLIYGLLSVLPNFLWQRFLESRFPGFPSWRRRWSSALTTTTTTTTIPGTSSTPTPPNPATTKGAPPKGEFYPRSSGSSSGVRNFLAKFLLDQTVGSVMNIVLFVVLINLLKGVSWAACWGLVREDFRPIMMARLKYRPLVSVLMYTVVPVDRRVVFGSACGVIWGVYLSLYAVV
ncbi:uncharacterized protein BO72DRAFT_384073 [Aspergillus fijiensis CBS 313.89]|uniref:Integral membrane protein, Mpv17/PMP22 family n=1 Tax=Aspergillus fijiensis CBS 313.89 TaxID=1448319 RepID=A0A8G1VX10_9EURO|nr:uncharacterized protein BO72DRAFT_384073 [Aspergillus fijiensis CBS 313.89]RAK74761.1 hypothetical protein BO72DRAFT_384073 [Aspergillus fijiensis CBS 313.89]